MKPGDDRPPGWLTLVACLAAVPLGIGITNGWWSAWWLLYAPALILLVGVLVIGCTAAIRLLSWWWRE